MKTLKQIREELGKQKWDVPHRHSEQYGKSVLIKEVSFGSVYDLHPDWGSPAWQKAWEGIELWLNANDLLLEQSDGNYTCLYVVEIKPADIFPKISVWKAAEGEYIVIDDTGFAAKCENFKWSSINLPYAFDLERYKEYNENSALLWLLAKGKPNQGYGNV